MIKGIHLATATIALSLTFSGAASAQTTAKKPNIVMIMGDDVGMWDISAYHRGMMGGSTPNIDRIAKEGALFTDYYAQQFCTAGRAAFIPGLTPFRTGLLKVGLPAPKQGLQDTDPTIADGGPLPPHPNMDPNAKFNMESVDEELVRRSVDFIDRSAKADTPFFLWHNATRTHVWTHLSPRWQDKSGYGLYADAMMELDWEVGEILKKIDDLGIADNTIVIFTSDNGAETFSWPDGGNHPFRGEKGTTFEGGFRVPMVARWPGTIKPNTIVNEIFATEDWMPTLLAGAGDPEVKEKLLKGMKVGDKTFKVHLDGYSFVPYLKAQDAKGPRHEFFYFTDNGDLTAVRYDDWKVTFKTIKGNLFTGTEESTNVPLVTNLRQDPRERYQDQSMMYARWWGDKLWTLIPSSAIVGQFLMTFKEYPPSQTSGTFGIEKALKMIEAGSSGGGK